MNSSNNNFLRYLTLCSASLAAALTLLAVHALTGQWTWEAHMDDNLIRHVPQLSAQVLPIPIAFMLWLWLMERLEQPFTTRFSPIACVLTIECLTAGQGLDDMPDLRRNLFIVAIVCALFISVPFKDCLERANRHRRASVVALIAAMAAINYYALMLSIWTQMCGWTLTGVRWLLTPFGMNMHGFVTLGEKSKVLLASPSFTVEINPGCNGLEGIFLFNFMLSVVLLVDWDMFKRHSIAALYAFGIVYMFIFNVLRIAAVFTLGYWTFRDDVPPWVQQFRGAPVDLFHSYVGWVFYLVAFGLFAAWLYRPKAREVTVAVDRRE